VERKQIIGLYTLQSGVLAVLGALIGIFFGYVLCKAAASTNAFLDFSGKDVSVYRFTPAMLFYALAAGLVAVLFMTLPVLALSKRTIVQQKKAAMPGREKSFWEKYFLDVILLLIACYLLYNYNKQTDILALSILSGDSLDPLIFLDASLFIFACGLFLLRLLKYFVRLVYFVGRKHWKPAMYASFLQITRSFRKQGFISVFLVLTIAMGIFDSNMARTINQNNEERIRYDQGTDVRVQETWKMRVFRPTETETYRMYTEPDYERYTGLLDENICESMTRVITDENTNVTAKSKTVSNCKLMAIQTKEFGETASLKQGLTEEHWYNYLNTLSQQQDGVIISRNLAERLGLQVGDTITYTRTNSIFTTDDQTLSATGVSVCAIVDAWPGYDQYSYTKNEDGTVTEEENYLLVANYAAVVDTFELTPYSIWMKLSPGKTLQDVTDYLANAEINTESIVGTEEEITAMKDSALIQITNGMFTISFLISVILCSVGFLIYWIMSIRKRELSFGIYRAMGMSMGEINQMLVNEQIFSSLLSGIAGGGVGMLATFLFAKLLAVVYLPEKHNVSIEVLMGGSDMIKLFLVVLAVLVICLLILRNLVKNMKIAQALKLGED
jgi:putative ABC transport system permease protein